MYKTPNRPKKEITQSYNSGIVEIYTVTDKAKPGYKPSTVLASKVRLRYEEQRLGIQRYYASKQNQIDIERVIRCQRYDISTQDVAITEDGQQYNIKLVQTVDNVWPLSIDITLGKVAQKIEVEP